MSRKRRRAGSKSKAAQKESPQSDPKPDILRFSKPRPPRKHLALLLLAAALMLACQLFLVAAAAGGVGN